jgi:hypothetical protein
VNIIFIQASEECITNLRDYKRKIEKFGISAQQEIFSVQGGERDKNQSIGPITNSSISQTELAQALKTLTDAILASQGLSDNDKKEHVEMVDDIGEEAEKPNPNKRKLKSLADGLLATLKAVPDVVQAVTAVMPLLDQLHP